MKHTFAKSTRTCNQCGSPLVVVGKKTEKIDNYSPTIVTLYKCTNKDCQKDIDKKTLARIKDSNDQKLAKENRLKAKTKSNKKRAQISL